MRKYLKTTSILVALITCFFFGLSAQEAEYGMASYYGDEFHGSETASGQRYDKNALTAAHKSLPMGSRVRVTRMDNKKTVDVVINDRGPYLKGRIIDLSGKAADALGIRQDGTSEVRLDLVSKKGGKVATATKKKKKTSTAKSPPIYDATTNKTTSVKTPTKKKTTTKVAPKAKSSAPKEVFTAKGSTSKAKKAKSTTVRKAKAATVERISDEEEFDLIVPKTFSEYGVFKIELKKPKNSGHGVQVASFTNYANVMKQVSALQGKWFKNILVSIEKGANGQPLYKIILGPFPDPETAKSYKKHAAKKGIKGFVVNLENME